MRARGSGRSFRGGGVGFRGATPRRSTLRGTAPLAGLAGAFVLVASACGTGGPAPEAPAPAEACVVRPGPAAGIAGGPDGADARPPGTLDVGAVHPVDAASAPVPRNPDEAFVFGHLYETLTRMDCTGRPHPVLASGWRSDDGGRRWTFTLRDDRRFRDGAPVRAVDVAESWNDAERTGLRPWGGTPPAAIEVAGDDRIVVIFRDPRPDAPRLLAHPALAVVRRDEAADWPIGTGPYRVAADAAGGGGTLELERAAADERLPSRLRIRIDAGADPRDLLDRGVDLLVTGDPPTLEYAGLRGELSTVALPWDRTYGLVAPAEPTDEEPEPGGPETGPGGAAGDGGAGAAPGTERPPADFLEALAREGVRAEARAVPASADGAGEAAASCRAATAPTRILHPADDPTARQLAERLVALASASGGSRDRATERGLRALGLSGAPGRLVAEAADPAELPTSVAPPGSPWGGTLPPTRFQDPDDGGRPLASRASGTAAWVVPVERLASPTCVAADGGSAAYRVVPLIETRRRLVVRSTPTAPIRLAPMRVGADGAPAFAWVPAGGR